MKLKIKKGEVKSTESGISATGAISRSVGIEGKMVAMETERCAHLMNCAIAGNVKESWIAVQPSLFLTYLRQYLPIVALPIFENARF